MTETILTRGIITFSVFWIIFIGYYAYKNDFSAEILSFFLPAIGTIFLSFILGAKFIWIDAPKKAEPFRCTIVILHDEIDNAIYGLALKESDYKRTDLNRNGLITINNYQNYINSQKLLSPSKDNDSQLSKILLDCLEHNIIDWIKTTNAINNSWYNQEYVFHTPGGGYSESATNLLDEKMISKSLIDEKSFPQNVFFKKFPVKCNLPSKSKIESFKINDFRRKFIIKSQYSKIEFLIQQIGGGQLLKSTLPYYDQLAEKWKNDSKRKFTQFSYQIEIEQECFKFSRFSKEAKLHPEWYKVLTRKFEEAFSFEIFKQKKEASI